MKYRIIKPHWAKYSFQLQVQSWFGWKTLFSGTKTECETALEAMEDSGLKHDSKGNWIYLEKEI